MEIKKTSKLSMSMLLLIPLCVAINFVGAQITHALKLPIYLDVIGTVLCGGLCGPLVGALTGLITNLTTSITAPAELPYAIVSMSVGIVAGLCAKKGAFKEVKGTIIAGILVWLIVLLTVNPIAVIFFGGSNGVTGGSVLTTFFIATGKGLWTSVIGSSLITETIDKFISVFVVFFILKSIPSRTLLKFPLGSMYIKEKANSTTEADWE